MFLSFLLPFLLLLLLLLLTIRLSPSFSSLPLPPGPRTSWFQRSVTSLYPWITYAKWKDIYGPWAHTPIPQYIHTHLSQATLSIYASWATPCSSSIPLKQSVISWIKGATYILRAPYVQWSWICTFLHIDYCTRATCVLHRIGWDWAFSTMAYGERWKVGIARYHISLLINDLVTAPPQPLPPTLQA